MTNNAHALALTAAGANAGGGAPEQILDGPACPELVGAAQLVWFHLKPGSFLHCPHGPLLYDWTQTDYVDAMFDAVAAAGCIQKVVYVRLNPPLAGLESVFQAHGAHRRRFNCTSRTPGSSI